MIFMRRGEYEVCRQQYVYAPKARNVRRKADGLWEDPGVRFLTRRTIYIPVRPFIPEANPRGIPAACDKRLVFSVFPLIIFAIFAGAFFLFPVHSSFAQSVTDVAARRAELQKELNSLQAQIDAQQAILTSKEQQSESLQRDVDILNAQINRSELSIKARAITIQSLSDGISTKGVLIQQLGDTITHEQTSIAELIRQTDMLDKYSLAETILSGRTLSEFFADVQPFADLKQALKQSMAIIADNKSQAETQKQQLEDQKTEQQQLLTLQQLEKQRIQEEQAQKRDILTATKGLESVYKRMIADSQNNAAKIRSELFTLTGSAAIPFEKALQLATVANEKTGIRPAFLLGIITEESNLGENVGTGNWQVDMADPRDTVPFQKICSALGLNPDSMPVSKKAWYGYGGAMGPAQFLPSTWVLYQSRIADATGHNPPNPWDPNDAFMAASIYLTDSGAAKQTVSAERYAALCYLAGCRNAYKKAYQFYADDVMDFATKYQDQINILNGSN